MVNYSRIYEQIINYFRLHPPQKYEVHHIIPRSLGGSNDELNLVHLSPRAHYLCHLLLVKIHRGAAREKMLHALNLMSNLKRYTSKQYDFARSKISAQLSKIAIKRNKTYWADPLNHVRASQAQTKVNAKLEVKLRKSESQKRAWASEQIRHKQRQISKLTAQRPEVNKKLREALKVANCNPLYSLHRSEAQKRRWATYRKNQNVENHS